MSSNKINIFSMEQKIKVQRGYKKIYIFSKKYKEKNIKMEVLKKH